MTRLTTLSTLTLTLLAPAWIGCRESPNPAPPSTQPAPQPAADDDAAQAEKRTEQQLVALGKHLVSTSGCHDCHTPFKLGENGPEPDMSRMLSGHPADLKLPPAPPPSGPWIVSIAATNTAYAGPWGTSFTANLTPDVDTGLGSWSKETFIQTIRTGRHMGHGRPLLPPMPVPVYQNFSDEELGAIFSYLQTIPAQQNKVPEPLPPPAAKKRG